jgi:hypothetical protein
MELVVVRLETMPLLLRIHLLHLLTQSTVLVPQNLETLVEPLEPLQHRHATLLPEYRSDLRLVRPHLLLLLLLVVVALSHRRTLLEKLGSPTLVDVGCEGGRLHQWRFGVERLLQRVLRTIVNHFTLRLYCNAFADTLRGRIDYLVLWQIMSDDLLRISLRNWFLTVNDGGLCIALEQILLSDKIGVDGVSSGLHYGTVDCLRRVVHEILSDLNKNYE